MILRRVTVVSYLQVALDLIGVTPQYGRPRGSGVFERRRGDGPSHGKKWIDTW